MLDLPQPKQLSILSDAIEGRGSFSYLFLNDKGLLSFFTNKYWLNEVTHQHDALADVHTMADVSTMDNQGKSSYQLMGEVMTPMATMTAAVVLEQHADANLSVVGSAPPYQEAHMLLEETKSEDVNFQGYVA